MVIFTNLSELQLFLSQQRNEGKTIGLVPTMGALHAGHMSLIKGCKKENDLAICNIYVNPTQFNNASDLQLYPRTLETDCQLLEEAGCDIVFVPSNEIIYPSLPKLRFDFGHLERVMEGKFRPGHFNGVGLIVSKLFHMMQPNRAYFGQKDIQQFLIIRQMVIDLSFNLQLVCCPIMREVDGLAMSSRNTRLTLTQRQQAPVLHQALLKAQKMLFIEGVSDTKQAIHEYFATLADNDLRLEYFEIVDGEDLREVKNVQEHVQVALCIAAYLGEVRLIDNVLLFS
ncbi:MAG: pantoate--beta-alanine ligase [Bacteroidota bacterium]